LSFELSYEISPSLFLLFSFYDIWDKIKWQRATRIPFTGHKRDYRQGRLHSSRFHFSHNSLLILIKELYLLLLWVWILWTECVKKKTLCKSSKHCYSYIWHDSEYATTEARSDNDESYGIVKGGFFIISFKVRVKVSRFSGNVKTTLFWNGVSWCLVE
jgi:hypothetical protein